MSEKSPSQILVEKSDVETPPETQYPVSPEKVESTSEEKQDPLVEEQNNALEGVKEEELSSKKEKTKSEVEAALSEDERLWMQKAEKEYLESYSAYYQKRGVARRLWGGAVALLSDGEYVPGEVKEKREAYLESRSRYASKLMARAEERLSAKKDKKIKTEKENLASLAEGGEDLSYLEGAEGRVGKKTKAEIEKIREAYRARIIFNEVIKPAKEKELMARESALSSREKTRFDALLHVWQERPQWQKVLISAGLVGAITAAGVSVVGAGMTAGAAYGGILFGRRLVSGAVGGIAGGWVAEKIAGKIWNLSDEEVRIRLQKEGRAGDIDVEELRRIDKKRGKLLSQKETDALNRARVRLAVSLLVGGGAAITADNVMNGVFGADSPQSEAVEGTTPESGDGSNNAPVEETVSGSLYEPIIAEVKRGQGAIQMFEQLQERIRSVQESGGELSLVAEELLSKKPTLLAEEYGFYKPNQEAESALIHKGDKLVLDDTGTLLFESKKGDIQVLATGSEEGVVLREMAQMQFADTTPKSAAGSGARVSGEEELFTGKELSERVMAVHEVAQKAGVAGGEDSPHNAWAVYKDSDAASVYWSLYDTEVGKGVPGAGDLFHALEQTLQLTHEAPIPGETVAEYFDRTENLAQAERRVALLGNLHDVPAQMPAPTEGFSINDHGVRVWDDVPHLYRDEQGYVVAHGADILPNKLPGEELYTIAAAFAAKHPGVPVLFFNNETGAIGAISATEKDGTVMIDTTIKVGEIGKPLSFDPVGASRETGFFGRLFESGPTPDAKKFTDIIL